MELPTEQLTFCGLTKTAADKRRPDSISHNRQWSERSRKLKIQSIEVRVYITYVCNVLYVHMYHMQGKKAYKMPLHNCKQLTLQQLQSARANKVIRPTPNPTASPFCHFNINFFFRPMQFGVCLETIIKWTRRENFLCAKSQIQELG